MKKFLTMVVVLIGSLLSMTWASFEPTHSQKKDIQGLIQQIDQIIGGDYGLRLDVAEGIRPLLREYANTNTIKGYIVHVVYDYLLKDRKKAHQFVQMTKKQIGVVTNYDFSYKYYGNGGHPPENTGVCTDVIWRAYRDMGLNFEKLLWNHGRRNSHLYSNFGDANIAYRRVKNINTYMKNTAQRLTTDMVPGDTENLSQRQAGDIVVFDAAPPQVKQRHIGVISDKKRSDGVPYMIDNHGYGVKERITPLDRKANIVGHYRVF